MLERWRPWWARPWRPFEEMERRMEDAFARFPIAWRRFPLEEAAWAPALEVYEKEDKFVVRAELPGMKREEIDVSVLGNTLSIKGERKAEKEIREEEYHRCEMCYGAFSRSVTLPAAIESGKVSADYKDGILEVTLPKAEVAKPQKIEVKVK